MKEIQNNKGPHVYKNRAYRMHNSESTLNRNCAFDDILFFFFLHMGYICFCKYMFIWNFSKQPTEYAELNTSVPRSQN